MTINFDQHISAQFNADLEKISSHMMSMGGLVERQVVHAIEALISGDSKLAEEVIRREEDVNKLELEIDYECTQILARRQPTASDLRMVISVSRVVSDLERIGDKACKIARQALDVGESPAFCQQAIRSMGAEVVKMVNATLDAFTRHDVEGALAVMEHDDLVDQQYASAVRELVTYMMEDPRSISKAISILWILRSIERIGDHARNISQQVVYLVKGTDVRHKSRKDIDL